MDENREKILNLKKFLLNLCWQNEDYAKISDILNILKEEKNESNRTTD